MNEKSAVQNCPKNRLGDNLKMFSFSENLKDCWVLFSNTERQSGLVFFVIFSFFFVTLIIIKNCALKLYYFPRGRDNEGRDSFLTKANDYS